MCRCLPFAQVLKSADKHYSKLKTICVEIQKDLCAMGYSQVGNQANNAVILANVLQVYERKRKLAGSMFALYNAISTQHGADRRKNKEEATAAGKAAGEDTAGAAAAAAEAGL